MLYRSAQTAPGGKTYTFEEAIMAGWAEDGGMLMPVDTPRVSRDTLRAWATLSYPQLVMAFLKMYVGADEVGDADLEGIISGAFAQCGDTEVVKMRGLDAAATMPWLDAASGPVHVLELWHGPTLAFKDLGMQVLVHFLKFFLARRQERITLLVNVWDGHRPRCPLLGERGLGTLQAALREFPVLSGEDDGGGPNV